MIAALIAAGSGFVLHELAHKYFAIKYGARARFQAWPLGLVFALALAIVPVIIWGPGASVLFIAPGAVYIYSMHGVSRKENGIISIAGPATNWALVLIFLGIAAAFPGDAIIYTVAKLGAELNSWLALFNLIPFFPFDGSKVYAWDWKIWLTCAIIGIGLVALAYSSLI
jgi:Zn-dependent protease